MRTYRSAPATPRERGLDFGQQHSAEVARTLTHYRTLFDAVATRQVDLQRVGAEAMTAIRSFSAAAAEEIEGIAAGASVSALDLAAINARTEVLAQAETWMRGECSTVVHLGRDGRAVSVQTWDWHDLFAVDWLLWTIEHPDGVVVHTITEYGILGKIGVNNRGLGVHVNILHHDSDGGPIGVPVHVLARTVLDTGRGIGPALSVIGAAQTSASTALTLIGVDETGSAAISAELAPIGPRFLLPSVDGLLLHTNHFLDPNSAAGDREPRNGPDSFLRLDIMHRALFDLQRLDRDSIVDAMSNHMGAGGALCCHPEDAAALGDRWATLVTVALDVAAGTMAAREGGPCNVAAPWEGPAIIATHEIGAKA